MQDKNGREHAEKGNSNGGQFVSKTQNDTAKKEEMAYKWTDGAEGKRKSESKKITKDEFYGEEFKGYKGADAIEKLLKEKNGHIKAAFYRKEIGDIDLVWGNKDAGLNHLIQRRDKSLASGAGQISGIDMARKIPEIIEKGTFYSDKDDKLHIDYDGYKVAICPKYYDEKVNWIITAYDLK